MLSITSFIHTYIYTLACARTRARTHTHTHTHIIIIMTCADYWSTWSCKQQYFQTKRVQPWEVGNMRIKWWIHWHIIIIAVGEHVVVYSPVRSWRDEYPIPKNALLCSRAKGHKTRPFREVSCFWFIIISIIFNFVSVRWIYRLYLFVVAMLFQSLSQLSSLSFLFWVLL